ncbi:MAG: transposase, partial [Chloroflexota bacterium]|nr:transposase [Chloroflexota bacterium]
PGAWHVEELVASNHFYRHVEQVLDLSFVRDLVRPCYAAGGRPSIDPVVFFKLQLIMFFEGIRSERQLMQVAADRLSLRWFLGYDLHEPLPDHSSLARIRDRYGVELFRRFFDRIIEQCQQHGLVWGRELYFDSTQVEANADRDKMLPRFYVEAMNEHLAALFPKADPSPQEPFAFNTAPLRLPLDLSAEAEAALALRNAARHDWMVELGHQQRGVARGGYQRQADIWANTTDPDATIMHKKGGGIELGYHTHYAVDGGKARIILRVLVTPSEVMDNQPMLDLLWHSRFRLLPLLTFLNALRHETCCNICQCDTSVGPARDNTRGVAR